MLLSGDDVEDIARDLCFFHRKYVADLLYDRPRPA
jgi:hypothetical protein